MIPVKAKPEPVDFDRKVRKPGLAWINKAGLDANSPIPKGKKISALWGKCADQLWNSYDGICAYSCFYIHRTAGVTTVEHFAPKSRRLSLAFEWRNFRLACALMNSRKSDYEDVLDPFEIDQDTFQLDLVTGEVTAGPKVTGDMRKRCELTVKRLKLNEPKCQRDRMEVFDQYVRKDISLDHFRTHAPFVWHEAERQGFLRV